MDWVSRSGLTLAFIALGACRSHVVPTEAPDAGASPSNGDRALHRVTIEPSPLLELVRNERELSELPTVSREREVLALQAESDDADEARDPHEPEAVEEENVREIRVKTTRFATWESLARYALRHAEKRRPRELHESRFLVRVSGAVKTPEGGSSDRAAARRHLRDQRTEVKRCLVAGEARRPGAIVKAPSALVVEQSMRRGDLEYHFTVHFPGGAGAPELTMDHGSLDETTRECIETVLHTNLPDDLAALDLPIVAFGQQAFGYGTGALNAGLATQAATLGWVHYDRGEYHQALAYFEDAYWVFHRPEYKALVGMALEKLDRPEAAAEAYADYVEARGDSPEAFELRIKIRKLRGAPRGAIRETHHA